jgi:hypothetical protein
MKEGAPAGKRSVAEPCLPSVKEGGIEGREGSLFPDPAGRCCAEAKKKNLLTKVGALRMIFLSSAQQA